MTVRETFTPRTRDNTRQTFAHFPPRSSRATVYRMAGAGEFPRPIRLSVRPMERAQIAAA